jgi:hypothetical protein
MQAFPLGIGAATSDETVKSRNFLLRKLFMRVRWSFVRRLYLASLSLPTAFVNSSWMTVSEGAGSFNAL